MTHHHDLIRRMAAELDHYRQLLTDDRREVHPLAVESRAALSQPEPEVVGPTLDDIDEMCERRNFSYYYDDWGPSDQDSRTVLQSMMNEAIARWGRPAPAPAGERQAAPVPVAVSERPWERKGWCHPEERWAWFYNRRVGWRDAIPPESLKPPTLFPYTHSLPFNTLPLPSEEVEA